MSATLLPRLLVAGAVGAALAVGASGYGARFSLWGLGTAFTMLRWGAYAALAIAALAVVALAVPQWRGARPKLWAAALAIGGIAGAVPLGWMLQARGLPPINDITTDLANPPAFVAIAPLRASAPVTASYAGAATAEQQRRAYPDIVPIAVPIPPAAAYAKALATARASGWTIVAAEAAAGRIEATVTTPWFGFRDDVVIRVTPDGGGSRVDVRSVSRVGRGDLGANAARVRAFAASMAR